MFSRMRGFVSRHRHKFLASGAVALGLVCAAKYAQRRLREWQERETKEFLERTRRQQHFESTERTCDQTLASLSAALHEALSRTLDTEPTLTQLQAGPPNRLELWNELKVMVVARVAALAYASAMLAATLRVQLALLGGLLFRDAQSLSAERQQAYLSRVHHLLGAGLARLCALVSTHAAHVLSPMDLRRPVALADVQQALWAVQAAVAADSADPLRLLSSYAFGEGQDVTDYDDPNEPNPDPAYDALLRDTADLLDSEEVRGLAAGLVSRTFALLADRLAEWYAPPRPDGPFLHPAHQTVPLAKLLPVLNGFLAKGSFCDALTQQLIADPKLRTLAANVYEVFSSPP